MDGRKSPNWECLYSFIVKKGLFLSVYVDDIKFAGKKQNIDPMWKVLNKEVDFGRTNIFPWSCFLGLQSKTMSNKQRRCGQLQSPCLNREFPREELKNFHTLRNFRISFMVSWYWRSCEEVCGTILLSWQTRWLNNSTKYLLHASMTTTWKKKKWNLFEELSQVMLTNCSEVLCTWHVLEDLIF